MNEVTIALTELYNKIPRRHTTENVIEINSIVNDCEDYLLTIEAINPFYEKGVAVFFDELETIRSGIKKSNDNKASKKMKDNLFDEASGSLKDTLQTLITFYANGDKTE
jgi:hypothetical protein